MSTAEYFETNRRRWNELVAIHEQSAFYDLDGFKAGNTSLRPLERKELSDVRGKTLLHLQCHFGMDTLSWARQGAVVTGVDFSDRAIARASALAAEVGLEARFLCYDVYELPQRLSETFDIVYTSYGVLCLLPDMHRWADVVAHFVKPGGTFYIAEIHPIAFTLDDRSGSTAPIPYYRYFHAPEPLHFQTQGSYADRAASVQNQANYEWMHSLGDIVTALVAAGLRIEYLHEFPYCVAPMAPYLERGPDGWYRLPGGAETLPLLFTLKATK